MTAPSRVEQAEASIDMELAHLWDDLAAFASEADQVLAMRIARCAWACGYSKAMSEPERGGWMREHGYGVAA